MNIAILGSSFDPPHNGHLKIAKNILKSQKIDRVILMPVNIHPFAKKLTPAVHRLGMVKFLEEPHFAKASRGKKNIEVSDLELKKNSVSYSIDTLNILTTQYPNDHFYWIIGSDYLGNFTKWKDWQKILSDFGLIIVPRRSHLRGGVAPAAHLGGENQKNIIILTAKDFPPIDISSSEIKERVRKGKSIENLVPKEIENYIIRHKLYLQENF